MASSDILLQIYMPEKLVLDTRVDRVILPYNNTTLTVIPDRAPTLLTLDMGIITVLDEENKPIAEWVISGGFADIKENTCTILTEAAYNKQSLTLVEVKEMYEEFKNPFFEFLMQLLEKENNKAKS